MNAMIFAAGRGTRLKPLTDILPKALVPVGDKPLLQHVLDRVAALPAFQLQCQDSRVPEAEESRGSRQRASLRQPDYQLPAFGAAIIRSP